MRTILMKLAARGFQVEILGATNFDAEIGLTAFEERWHESSDDRNGFRFVNDGLLRHQLLLTSNNQRLHMLAVEEAIWHQKYISIIDEMCPDAVFFYGGLILEMMVANEAKKRGIYVVSYLANENYYGTRWCQDVDLILTNTQANASMYYEREGYSSVPIGLFVDPAAVYSLRGDHSHILFINPEIGKGVAIVIQLALWLEKIRPDIIFEIVQSRGDWNANLRNITSAIGNERLKLSNVIVTPNVADMRPIYARTKLLLAPSLRWESAGRVLVEAMLNGIPCIVTENGGMPELLHEAGIKIRLPKEFYQPPYNQILPESAVGEIAKIIIKLYDNQEYYSDYSSAALRVYRREHNLEENLEKLISRLESYCGWA